ncbi:MAG TPA: Cache 3/Cache 2 fusion domain-containing protein [Chthoniobacterales bacterium]|nr:Cache 3/Cache 2 fusion domain-containing protein [Chthoniobacterales bacterium]
MFRNNLVAFILTLACFVVLIPNLGSAQADKVKNSMAALKAETGKLGAPAVQSNELHFGKSKVSAELVDAVVKKHGGAATLFAKNGDQYVRVATTVKRRTAPARSEPPWTQIAPPLRSSTMVSRTTAM